MTAKFSKDRFIQEIWAAASENQRAVEQVMAEAVSEPGAVIRELGDPNQAGIWDLYCDDQVSVFNLVWPPHMIIAPHNHAMWASIGIYTGREDNILWKLEPDRLYARGAEALTQGDTYSLGKDAIHSVTNPIEKLTGAIHVYGGNLIKAERSQWDPETFEKRPFDVDEGRRLFERANRLS